MKCPNCESQDLDVRRENHVYEEAGLENVLLLNLEIVHCRKCDEKILRIPGLSQLNRTIAFDLVARPERLLPAEIRFLRKYLGYSQIDFAAIIDADPSTISRWENGKQEMGTVSERLLRLMVQRNRPVEEYPIEMLAKVAVKPARRRQTCFEKTGSGWHEAGLC